jgi:hypothetical protein
MLVNGAMVGIWACLTMGSATADEATPGKSGVAEHVTSGIARELGMSRPAIDGIVGDGIKLPEAVDEEKSAGRPINLTPGEGVGLPDGQGADDTSRRSQK